MYRYKPIYNVVSFALLAAGFLFSFWPVSLLGLVLAAVSGQYPAAVLIGLVMDTAYGAPVGRLHLVYVPFTLLSLAACALRFYVPAYFRRGDSGTL